MHWAEAAAILAAGVWAGAINTVVGSGTLVTFPVLVAFGYPPVVATMSNALGLVPGGFSGTWGYRRELRGQGRRLLRLLPASLLGALAGSWLLLHLPERAFEAVVPVLLVLALVLVVAQTRLQRAVNARREAAGRTGDPTGAGAVGLWLAVCATGVYGGYFTAAQGILLVGVMGPLVADTLQRINALKNVLSLGVNVVAACAYVLVAADRIAWEAVGLIAAGSVVGAQVGARIGRRLNPTALRGVIVVLGCVALWRFLTT
ncbi:sulfite exporter TauE/SafE family protein [Kineococcus sp. NUM-3379]